MQHKSKFLRLFKSMLVLSTALIFNASLAQTTLSFDSRNLNLSTGGSASMGGSIYYHSSQAGGYYSVFDGGDYINMPVSLLSSNSYSISMVVDTDGNDAILDLGRAESGPTYTWYNRIKLYRSSGNLRIRTTSGSSSGQDRVRSLSNSGGPYHIVLTRSGNQFKVYVNGVQKYSKTSSSRYHSGKAPNKFVLGAEYDEDYDDDVNPYLVLKNKFHGKMDEISIYNRTLTSSEVSSKYKDLIKKGFLFDFYDNGAQARMVLEENQVEEKISFSLFPNPSNGNKIGIHLGAGELNYPIEVKIYDLSGTLVQYQLIEKAGVTTNNLSKIQLHEKLVGGIYSVRIKQGELIQYEKLLVK